MDSPRKPGSASGTPKSPAPPGNLTGSARVLNDIVVSFYNSIQKWNEAYLNGVRLVQNIQSKNESGNEFQSSCEKLGALVDVLRLQLTQMRNFTGKLRSLTVLNDTSMRIGISWTFSNFVESAEALSHSYSVETGRKEKVAIMLKEFSPLSKEFEVLSLAWIQLSQIGPEEEMMLKAGTYEAHLGSP